MQTPVAQSTFLRRIKTLALAEEVVVIVGIDPKIAVAGGEEYADYILRVENNPTISVVKGREIEP